MELLYRNDEAADAAYLVNRMQRDGRIYMISRVAKSCGFIFVQGKYMEFYSRLCMKIISGESSEDAITYIVSIFKSMYEYHTENPDGNPEKYEKVLDAFVDSCLESGGEIARTGELLREISLGGFQRDYDLPEK